MASVTTLTNSPAPDSLARRLRRRLSLAISLLLVAAGLGVDGLIRLQLEIEFDRALLAKAQTLALLLEQDEDGVDFDFVPAAMPEFARGPHAEYFELWYAGWPQSRRADALQRTHLPRLKSRAEAARYRPLLLPDGRAGRSVQLDFLPHLDPNENLDPARVARLPATLLVARNRDALDNAIGHLRMGLLGIAALVLWGSWWLIGTSVARSLRPLAEIRAQSATLHPRALHTRLAVTAPVSELVPVVDQFNALLALLESAFSREQEFTAAAAHELRTPLAEIRSLAEVGGRFAHDSALACEYYSDIVAAVTQLESLTRNLLALARHDQAGSVTAGDEVVDLAQAVAQAWQREAMNASVRALRFEYRGPAVVEVYAIREMVDLILANLITNALAYCPPGAEISGEITSTDNVVALAFANPCEGLTAQDLPHVFERFWRKDAARHAAGHAGLGLALVRAYATQMGVKCGVHFDPAQRFVIRLEGFKPAASRA